MKTLILVDTSYTSYYRFFATIRWYSYAFKEEFEKVKNDNNYDWINNKVFLEKYEKMYLDSIIKLVKKKVFINSNIIFCMDTPLEKLWKTELYNNYKGDRIDLLLKYNYKSIFNYTYNTIIPNIIKSYNYIYKLRINKVEADDIIAVICMYDQNQQIYIISGDNDFLQLGRENLYFINYKNKKLVSLSKEQAQIELRNKILLGDVSDNIPSIFPKGTRKKELLASDIKLCEYLNKNPQINKIYELNKQIIDFKYIPKNYSDLIISSLLDLKIL